MKKLSFLIVSIIISNLAIAQNSSIVPIIQQTGDYIQLIEGKYEQQVVHLEYDVIKSNKEVYRQMFAGVQYGIILFTDGNFDNINLKSSVVENGEWKTISNEVGKDGIVMMYFTFDKTDFYKFDIIADLKEGVDYGYYGFLIFR